MGGVLWWPWGGGGVVLWGHAGEGGCPVGSVLDMVLSVLFQEPVDSLDGSEAVL